MAKLRQLMIIYQENLYHTQKLQKRAYNKYVKPRSYVASNKICLNTKYIKTKHNQRLKAKFFGPFQVLHSVWKQAYKLNLSKKWKIYNVFLLLLLQQDTIKKVQVDKNAIKLDVDNDNKKYKVKAIWDSAVHVRESESGYLL